MLTEAELIGIYREHAKPLYVFTGGLALESIQPHVLYVQLVATHAQYPVGSDLKHCEPLGHGDLAE